MDFLSAATLFGVFTIILADLLLAGDNALVIGMACRGLPPAQKKESANLGYGKRDFLTYRSKIHSHFTFACSFS
ncbi:hypothetical protein [Thermodesulfitimonas sp.]